MMQTSKMKNMIGVVTLTTLLFSCKKDFLEIQPTDKIAETVVLSDSIVFEAYVVNRYIGARLQDKEGDGTDPGSRRGRACLPRSGTRSRQPPSAGSEPTL